MMLNPIRGPVVNYNLKTDKTKELDKEAFLRLLVLQLQNQDPLDPLKNEDFIAQLAQLNTLEQMQNLNKTISSISNLQILSYTSSLIGKVVEAKIAEAQTVKGTVESINFSKGFAELVIKTPQQNEYYVTVDKILSVS